MVYKRKGQILISFEADGKVKKKNIRIICFGMDGDL